MLFNKAKKFSKVERYSEKMKSVSKTRSIHSKSSQTYSVKFVHKQSWEVLQVMCGKVRRFSNKLYMVSNLRGFHTQIERFFLEARMCSYTKLRGFLNLRRIRLSANNYSSVLRWGLLAKITEVQRFSSDAKLWSQKVQRLSKFFEGKIRRFFKVKRYS